MSCNSITVPQQTERATERQTVSAKSSARRATGGDAQYRPARLRAAGKTPAQARVKSAASSRASATTTAAAEVGYQRIKLRAYIIIFLYNPYFYYNIMNKKNSVNVFRTNNPTPMQQLPNYPAGGTNSQPKNQPARGNIAAVEPYNHVPHAQSLSHNTNFQVSISIFSNNTNIVCSLQQSTFIFH